MSNLGWSIRAATSDDSATLADIVIEATKTQGRWTPRGQPEEDEWRSEYAKWCVAQVEEANPGNILSVVEECGHPIGRLRVVRELVDNQTNGTQVRRIELAGIQLRPSSQGHGIGTAIIRDLQREAALQHVPLELKVEKDNPHARRLYERLGFTHVGENDNEDLMRWIES